jgi:hypothetical protein
MMCQQCRSEWPGRISISKHLRGQADRPDCPGSYRERRGERCTCRVLVSTPYASGQMVRRRSASACSWAAPAMPWGLAEMIIFLGILMVGFFYAWDNGALEWQ